MIKDYYRLTKPGIIYGNAVNASAGFFLASQFSIDLGVLVAMLLGLSLVIAAACVFNNYLDIGIDQKMKRTKNRALAAGRISANSALIYGCCLLALGNFVLAAFTNLLALFIALAGFCVYVFVYSPLKPRTAWATVIGSLAGAVPPVVGYCAVTNQLDSAALLLFLILIFWQMPHFYSIAIYRAKEYKAAKVPVLPLVKGVRQTKIYIAGYIIAFTVASALLTVLGYTGYVYLFVVGAACFAWLRLAFIGFNVKDDNAWARRMFGYSLIVTLVSALMIAVGGRLP